MSEVLVCEVCGMAYRAHGIGHNPPRCKDHAIMAKFTINDVSANPIQARAAFEYHGFTIRMSTIFHNSHHVAVYADDEYRAGFETVEAAIEFINKLHAELADTAAKSFTPFDCRN